MRVNPASARLPNLTAVPYKTRIAGEIKNFDPLQFVDKQEVRRYDDFILYALAAAEMAMADAKLTISPEFSERAGVIIGSAIGGIATLEEELKNLFRFRSPQNFSLCRSGNSCQSRIRSCFHPIWSQRSHQLCRYRLRRRNIGYRRCL